MGVPGGGNLEKIHDFPPECSQNEAKMKVESKECKKIRMRRGKNDILVIKKPNQKENGVEILIPFIKDYILKIPEKENTITVKWRNEF